MNNPTTIKWPQWAHCVGRIMVSNPSNLSLLSYRQKTVVLYTRKVKISIKFYLGLLCSWEQSNYLKMSTTNSLCRVIHGCKALTPLVFELCTKKLCLIGLLTWSKMTKSFVSFRFESNPTTLKWQHRYEHYTDGKMVFEAFSYAFCF